MVNITHDTEGYEVIEIKMRGGREDYTETLAALVRQSRFINPDVVADEMHNYRISCLIEEMLPSVDMLKLPTNKDSQVAE